MGGGSSKSSKKRVKNPVQQNWELLEHGQLYNIVKSKTDGSEAEQYIYTLDNRYDPSGQSHIFDRRNKSSLPIVRSFDYQWQTKGSGMVPSNNFRVVTERLPHRLSNCPQLSFDESLYVLDRALDGYNFLYRSIGAFDVNSDMIGFTPEGEVRVWHNPNFGKNYPFHEKRTLQSTRIDQTHRYESEYVALQEIEMVRNIINVIEDRCEQGQFPEEFRNRVRQNIGFSEARRVVQDELNQPERVRINRVDLWRNLVKSKITKLAGQTLGQTNFTNESFVIPRTVVSFMRQEPMQVNSSQYHTAFVAGNEPVKNAYSFNYQRPEQA